MQFGEKRVVNCFILFSKAILSNLNKNEKAFPVLILKDASFYTYEKKYITAIH